MLCACALDFRNKWVDNVAYAEFAYNNNFHSSIGMAPIEVLYGQKCQSLLYLGRLGHGQSVLDPLDLEETRQKVQRIKQILLAAQSQQKAYAYCREGIWNSRKGNKCFLN
jgi:hypothetical protein